MTVNAAAKATPICDTDYRAARRACSTGVPGEEDKLCAKLDGALKSGWSMLVYTGTESLRILGLERLQLQSCHCYCLASIC
jgi:hypothetical protein